MAFYALLLISRMWVVWPWNCDIFYINYIPTVCNQKVDAQQKGNPFVAFAHYRNWTDNHKGTDFKSVVFTYFTKWAKKLHNKKNEPYDKPLLIFLHKNNQYGRTDAINIKYAFILCPNTQSFAKKKGGQEFWHQIIQ